MGDKIANGDLVLVDYVGRVSNTGDIFDLTNEDKARSEGVYDEEADYGPVPVLIGHDYIVQGVEEALKNMKVGDSASIDVPSEKAFGQRSSDQVRTISESQFKESDVRAYPGSLIRVGGKRGKVIAKSSGRVKVDFNHPLAGKDLQYEVEIEQKVERAEDKIKKIAEYYFNNCLAVAVDGSKATVRLDLDPGQLPEELSSDIKDDIKFACSSIEEVELKEGEETTTEEEKE